MLGNDCHLEHETMSQTTVNQREEADFDACPQTFQAKPRACEDETPAGLIWDFSTLEQLARAQNVQPLIDVESFLRLAR